MTSEKYIIMLQQTTESFGSTIRSMREEITFLLEKVEKMGAFLEEMDIKRLWDIIEVKE